MCFSSLIYPCQFDIFTDKAQSHSVKFAEDNVSVDSQNYITAKISAWTFIGLKLYLSNFQTFYILD